jgi:hypothetical protein
VREPGWLARAIATLEASVLQHAAGVAEATTKLQCAPEASPEVWARLEHYLCYQRGLHSEVEGALADLARLSQQMTEDALAAEIARAGEAHISWVDMQRSELERMRRHILTQDLDALMGDESWAAMKAKMIAAQTEYWMWSDCFSAWAISSNIDCPCRAGASARSRSVERGAWRPRRRAARDTGGQTPRRPALRAP